MTTYGVGWKLQLSGQRRVFWGDAIDAETLMKEPDMGWPGKRAYLYMEMLVQRPYDERQPCVFKAVIARM